MMCAMASHCWSPASGRHLGSLLDLVVGLVLGMRRSGRFLEGIVRCNGRWKRRDASDWLRLNHSFSYNRFGFMAFPMASCLRAIQPLALGLCLGIGPAALAKEAKLTICCRSSGGTRGTCLNLWVQLVPPSNRFNPGSSRLIALLQGPSVQPPARRLATTTARSWRWARRRGLATRPACGCCPD